MVGWCSMGTFNNPCGKGWFSKNTCFEDDGDRLPMEYIESPREWIESPCSFTFLYIFGSDGGCQSWSVMLMMEQIWAFLETQHVSHSNYSSDLSHRCHDHWSWEKPLKSTCCIAKSSILYMSTSFPTMLVNVDDYRITGYISSPKNWGLPGFSNSNICFFPQTRPTARCWCVAVITAKIEIGWGLRIAKSQKKPLVNSVQFHFVPGFRVLTMASLWNMSIA